ncbi:MAG TPA: hypothetical protein VK815_13290, partial [Candidatus Acidoferrales bacterium]|nr:hypothetical protein [Candidatus Acidoferrales bacterium]
MRSVEVCRRFSLLAAVSIISIITPARAVNLVEEFYLPMPEQQIYTADNAIIPGSSANIFSTFSIVVTGNGTVIYYDQWEDGYEVNLASPTQPTTQIWGDGIDSNGIAPGFAHDPVGLPAGTVITLTNNVGLPRNPGTILWDARDRVAANKALVISRAGWPVTPGPVFAGAVGVLATIDYGTNYISPVGQNLPNNLFKYVGMFIMAAQNNTTVTIDPTGTGIGTTNIVLNQGESYLVNGGILKGGRVTSTKPIQADLIIGHVGASYASDWFTLYPESAWGNAYYTPVGTSKNGNVAYVYLYNPGTNAITINYNTQVGSGSFSVPGTNGVTQFPMPTGSGASFVSAGGQNFYALCTVAANNTSDTSFNWGFTLVPKPGLTTEATVGWGPGSADGTVDGSPVWVTALANTKLYVDYKGDHAGPLTDPNGNQYDTSFNVSALQSQKIFDPSKNQTGMRVYTLDGTLIAAAWGEDPDTAQPGNPYIDAGTTVVPFPTPLLFKSAVIVTDVPPAGLSVGDTILYTVQVNNKGLLPLGNTLVIDAPTTNLTYVPNSTTVDSNSIPDSATGTAFPLDAPGYTIPVILSQGVTTFRYLTVVNAGGVVSNSVNIGGTSISSQAFLAPTPTNGASVSLNFSDTNGASTNFYSAGANVYVNMTNAVGNTSSNSQQSINVTVLDVTSGDVETITLTETTTNTGIFRNITGLPTSTSSGLGQQDGTLHISPGDTLSVSYTDPVYFDSATNTATILVPTPNKQLYLSINGLGNGVQDLNRIDPVAYGHGPIHTSIDIGQGGGGSFVPSTIGVDGSYSTNTTAATLTFNYTTGPGTNRLMLVTVGVQDNSGGAPGVTGVTYNGTNLNQVGSALKGSSNPKYGVYLFSLANPLPGAGPIQVITTGGNSFIVGVDTFTNVNPAAPLSSTNTVTAGTSIAVNSATNQLVYGTVYLNGAVSLLAGQNASVQWSNTVNSYIGIGGTLVGSNSATTTMSWTASAYGVGVSINPSLTFVPGVGGGPATNATSFAQTPAFASSFTMPAGGAVTITNFITLTNGSLASGSAVTARLQTNGVSFLTLTNPVFNAGAGVNTNLVWTGTLATNVTIPTGQIITYVISNSVANTAFHINYDSTNAQSVIVLPASTVIQVATLGVYDAPFPNGSLVITPVAGNTVYIRAAVTDPFGAYDITSLGLAVIGPDAGSSFTNTLIGANVVTNDAFTKVYEYALTTGATAGGYNIAVTANEGTEGVSSVAASGITTIFLDLGTPSTTEFTSGANGIATNSYLGGSVISVRVTDLNRNTNATTIDQVIVTVTSSSGDLETLTLVETGINTGIFTNSINSSTSVIGTANDGTLYAPIGSILTASYSDPTDPTDNTSATA